MKPLYPVALITALSAVLATALAVSSAFAQSDGTHTLVRASITAGGVVSSNGTYQLNGTAGQAGFAQNMFGGGYGYFPEFWWNAEPAQRPELIFRDSFEPD